MTAASKASAEARRRMESRTPPDRLVVLNCFKAHKLAMGADECAWRLGGWKVERVRRRVTELHQEGALVETGQFATTESGAKQATYRAIVPGSHQLSLLESL